MEGGYKIQVGFEPKEARTEGRVGFPGRSRWLLAVLEGKEKHTLSPPPLVPHKSRLWAQAGRCGWWTLPWLWGQGLVGGCSD